MSLASTPSKLYVLLIACMGIIVGYVVYSQMIVAGQVPIPPVEVKNQDSLNTFRNLRLDFSVLTSSTSKELIISGESPVDPGTTGAKKDLFAPIQ